MVFTYLPPMGSPFYEQSDMGLLEDSLLTILASLPDVYMLLIGDFNCRTGQLQVYIVNWRLGKDKNKESFTYIDPNGCSLIDYLLLSRDLFDSISDFSIETRTESTHLPVKVVFYIRKHRGETDATISEDEENNSEIHYSRLPKDIGSFTENIKNASRLNF